jgi:ribA/ribD-fused uncharacterized protein
MSETTVVSLRTCPPGWEQSSMYAYIGRAGRGQSGYFGNSHPVGAPCAQCKKTHERGTALEAYRADFAHWIETDQEFRQQVQSLRGKKLVCFCKPRDCHGDVIAGWLNATEPVLGFFKQYRWLSNFAGAESSATQWQVVIQFEGMQYPSVEHAYQAAKTLNEAERKTLAQAPLASQTKRLGRRITMRPNWNEIRVSVMQDLLFQKFSPTLNPTLAQLLWNTGERELVELNTWGDDFWGMVEFDPTQSGHVSLPRSSYHGLILVGFNHLGRLLMKVRRHLQEAMASIEQDALRGTL